MSEELTNEDKARNLGWVPQEEFRGDPSRWIDADTFVERGEHIMPILKANNGRLQEEVAGLRGELSRMQQVIQAGQEAIQELKDFHNEDTQKKVERARKDLLAEMKAAKREGDTDREVDLQGELFELDAAIKEEKAAPRRVQAPPQPVVDPEFGPWQSANPWFGQDRKKTALVTAIAEELRADPKNNGLVGRRFYETAAAQAEKILSGNTRQMSKVESSEGRSSGSSHTSGSRSFNDLPAEARETCNRQAAKLVGEGRAFKTNAEWQKHYVEQYFQGE